MGSEKNPGKDKVTSRQADEVESREGQESKEERKRSFARRALIKAGWVAPVIMSVKTPVHAQATPPHTDSHADAHTDTAGPPHNDVHSDFHGDM